MVERIFLRSRILLTGIVLLLAVRLCGAISRYISAVHRYHISSESVDVGKRFCFLFTGFGREDLTSFSSIYVSGFFDSDIRIIIFTPELPEQILSHEKVAVCRRT